MTWKELTVDSLKSIVFGETVFSYVYEGERGHAREIAVGSYLFLEQIKNTQLANNRTKARTQHHNQVQGPVRPQ